MLDWQEIGPSHVVTVGELTCRFVATDHGPPTLAVRVDSSAADHVPSTPTDRDRPVPSSAVDDHATSFAYSADSGPDWSVDELGHGIGTVLCEATYSRRDEGASRHLSGRQAGPMAAAAGVGRLLLTHRWPTVSADAVATEAAEAFGRHVDQVVAGRVFEW